MLISLLYKAYQQPKPQATIWLAGLVLCAAEFIIQRYGILKNAVFTTAIPKRSRIRRVAISPPRTGIIRGTSFDLMIGTYLGKLIIWVHKAAAKKAASIPFPFATAKTQAQCF